MCRLASQSSVRVPGVRVRVRLRVCVCVCVRMFPAACAHSVCACAVCVCVCVCACLLPLWLKLFLAQNSGIRYLYSVSSFFGAQAGTAHPVSSAPALVAAAPEEGKLQTRRSSLHALGERSDCEPVSIPRV